MVAFYKWAVGQELFELTSSWNKSTVTNTNSISETHWGPIGDISSLLRSILWLPANLYKSTIKGENRSWIAINIFDVALYSASLALRYALLIASIVFLVYLSKNKLQALPLIGNKITWTPIVIKSLKLGVFFILGIYLAILLAKIFTGKVDYMPNFFKSGSANKTEKGFMPYVKALVFGGITIGITTAFALTTVNNYINLNFVQNSNLTKLFESKPEIALGAAAIVGFMIMITILLFAAIKHNQSVILIEDEIQLVFSGLSSACSSARGASSPRD